MSNPTHFLSPHFPPLSVTLMYAFFFPVSPFQSYINFFLPNISPLNQISLFFLPILPTLIFIFSNFPSFNNTHLYIFPSSFFPFKNFFTSSSPVFSLSHIYFFFSILLTLIYFLSYIFLFQSLIYIFSLPISYLLITLQFFPLQFSPHFQSHLFLIISIFFFPFSIHSFPSPCLMLLDLRIPGRERKRETDTVKPG